MHRIFGRAKPEAAPAPPPDVGAHVQGLQAKETQLNQQIADIDKQLLDLKRQMQGKNPAQAQHLKQQAMFLLKRKNMYVQQRGAMQTRTFQIEQANFALSTVQGVKEQAEIMKFTASELKSAQKGLNLDELEDLYDDMQDGMYDVEEINDVMSRDFMVGEQVNEADLDAELAGLDAEMASLPAAPVAQASRAAAMPSGVDAELAALDAGGSSSWAMPVGPAVPGGLPALPAAQKTAVPAGAAGAAGGAPSYYGQR